MRVALLTFYPSEKSIVPGGIRAVSYNLVQSLRAYGDLELHVIHCHSDIAEDRLMREERVTVHYLAMPRQRILPNLVTSIGRIVRAVRAVNPDLVHAHAAHFAYAGVRAGYPTIYTIHGVLPREVKIYTRTLFDRLRYSLLAYYERQALRGVRQVVAISQHVLEEYAPVGRGAWVRIDNPVSQEFFELADRSVDESCFSMTVGGNEARPLGGRVLYVGSIDERKDLLMLLRAMEGLRRQCAGARLVVAGRVNSPEYERRVREYVAAHALGEIVELRGFLDRPGIMAEYERCSVVALPSLEENAPMAVIEAMAAGKPVVATAVGGVPDIVVEGETGFIVPPGDDAAMAHRLGQLLADEELRGRLGRRAREVARARFHAEQIARRYYELYRQVLAPDRVNRGLAGSQGGD
jgi:glycosyltransferase involved in cell wall biosynthesis